MLGGIGASLRRVAAIANNTFVEAARNRAFVGLGVAAIGFVASSLVLSSLALADQMTRVLVDFGLFAVGLLEALIAIVMGVILVYKEVDRKTFYLILPKPVRREEVLAGKYVGLLAVLVVALVLMGAAWLATLGLRAVPIRPDFFKALLLIWMEAAVVTAGALFFSTFATPVMSGVFALALFVVGRDLHILDELLGSHKGTLATNAAARAIAKASLFVLPDLSVFAVGKEIILGIPVTWDYVGSAGLYALGYVVLFLALGALAFRRRDFV